MLSILIPTYQYDCTELVKELKKQCDFLGMGYEIIVVDDGSDDSQWIGMAKNINGLINCKFIRREKNVGRSSIRNFLITQAKGDALLFIDQDGKVIRKDFISRYIQAEKTHDVVCGGIVHSNDPPSKEYMLRYLYEKQYESNVDVDKLNANPNSSFRSFCFLIKREVAKRVKMDERYNKYGYEDIRYGMDLRKAGYKICYIDNPLMNNDLEDNSEFVEKTEVALTTLYKFREELKDNITLIKRVSQLKKCRLIPILTIIGYLVRNPIRSNLCSLNPNIRLFNIYKLLYYINIKDV